jgi:hypothetical protein
MASIHKDYFEDIPAEQMKDIMDGMIAYLPEVDISEFEIDLDECGSQKLQDAC